MIKFSCIMIMPFCCALYIFGCAGRDVDREIRSLADNQWSASGSSLVSHLCGWPVNKKIDPEKLSVDLTPGSGSKYGSGYADMTANGDCFKCAGKIFFTYSSVYMGGHGSGGSSITLGLIQRENEVEAEIASPTSAKRIMTGGIVNGRLDEADIRLPDGSYADFYYIELSGNDPGLKVLLKKTGNSLSDFSPRCFLYHNNILVSTYIDDQYGVRLKPGGRAYMLISSGEIKGEYTLKVDNISDADRAMLKQPRY